LRRAVQTWVEDPLSEEYLQGRLKRDTEVSIGVKDGKAVFHTQEEKKNSPKSGRKKKQDVI
jgi:ATP-dependent Clp protease ATP-binding subunit ClpA